MSDRFQPIARGADGKRLEKLIEDALRALERRFEEIGALSRITSKVNSGLVLAGLLDQLYETFRPVIPYERIGVAFLAEDSDLVRAVWIRGDGLPLQLKPGYAARLAGSTLADILKTGEPRIINDLDGYLRDHPGSESTRLILSEGIRSNLTCPLVVRGRPVGFLFFSSVRKDAYRGAHVEVFQQIAADVSMVVERARLYQQMIDLKKTKYRFLGLAAHDLRSPITALAGFLKLMRDGALGALTDPQRDATDQMGKCVDALIANLNDILDVTAIQTGHLELNVKTVDLEALLREAVEANRIAARSKRIDFDLDLRHPLPPVRADPVRIRQVLDNLLSNAVKYSYPGSPVSVGAAPGRTSVMVFVADRGQGIPREDLPKIFQEFGRASVAPTGGEKSTGLGLAIVKRIVEAHGGSVDVKSDPGDGSIFSFTLPLRPGETG